MATMEIREGRSGRTLALELNEAQRRNIWQLTKQPGWNDLLDIMEMQCIATETDMVNVPVDEEARVLASHKLAKAAWQFFVWVQRKVAYEVNEVMAGPPQGRLPKYELNTGGDKQNGEKLLGE